MAKRSFILTLLDYKLVHHQRFFIVLVAVALDRVLDVSKRERLVQLLLLIHFLALNSELELIAVHSTTLVTVLDCLN